MKTYQSYSCFLVFFLVLLISCSRDGESKLLPEGEKAILSFAAVVNDIPENKQATGELPECSGDEPSYVQIVLTQGEDEILGTDEDPFRIDLVTGQIFTEEVPELELDPGTYTLTHFAVFNAGGELIWLAPRGGMLGEFVEDSLPLSIDLNAGVKKYVNVPVLCYDERIVNEYGYLFFDLNQTEAFEFCFFANYCNEDGRHFPAAFALDIWLGTDRNGTMIYSGSDPEMQNSVSTEGEDPSAAPLCVALPVFPGVDPNEDYLYYEVTLLDWEGVYGNVTNNVISGTLSRNDIEANFIGGDNMDYEHLRFGCEGEQGDADGDGVPDEDDLCPETPADTGVDFRGCPISSCVRYPADPELCFQVYVEMTVESNGRHDIVYNGEIVGYLDIDVLDWWVTDPEDDVAIRIGAAGGYGSIYDSEIMFPEYDYSECLRLGFFYEEHTVVYDASEFPFDVETVFPLKVIVRANICEFGN